MSDRKQQLGEVTEKYKWTRDPLLCLMNDEIEYCKTTSVFKLDLTAIQVQAEIGTTSRRN